MNNYATYSCAAASVASRRGAARGFSLVELMIAITLGLLILAGVTSVFLGSKQSFRSQESLGEVQEAGRFVTYFLYPYIRQAGYLADPLAQIDPTTVFLDPASGLASDDLCRGIWGLDAPGGTNPFGVTAYQESDLLVTRFVGQDQFGTPGTTDNSVQTCRGQALNAGEMGENVYYIDINPDTGAPTLYCRTRVLSMANCATTPVVAALTQPLIPGVVNLQLLFGEDTNPADDNPNPPAQPGLIPNEFVAANAVTDWSRVAAVRAEITTQSVGGSEGGTSGASLVSAMDIDGDGNFDDEIRYVDNRELRRVFSSTVLIRNRLRE